VKNLLNNEENGSGYCINSLYAELRDFKCFGTETREFTKLFGEHELPYFVNEFWTSKQRAAHSLHELSYRACFKPQLPRFFIERLTKPGDIVYDPFMGRGTTLIEAALLDRIPCGCDVNPLSLLLCAPRLSPPTIDEIEKRLAIIPRDPKGDILQDLLAFYHPITLAEITALREYLLGRDKNGEIDDVDQWIRMVATNRLTGHSPGFFSVYTLPPNQAVSVESQLRINAKRKQIPPRREVAPIILKKTRTLLKDLAPLIDKCLWARGRNSQLVTSEADKTKKIRASTIQLVVTSPPFLDVVNYKQDNWLRCWFNGIDPDDVGIWHFKKPEDWQNGMQNVFKELRRVLRPGGFVAFEVGEVRNGSILLEDLVVPAGQAAGLSPEAVLINDQKFTKTSNCWGVDNLKKGTNTNRIVLFSRPE
jgi:hypothetical protein